MAEQGSRGNPTAVRIRVWTFLIVGGQPFQLKLQNNPPLNHSGQGRTVWHLVGDKALMETAREHIVAQGATVIVYMQDESPEQRQLREERLRGFSIE